MDSTPAVPPRLRVSRYKNWSRSDHSPDTPQAGPSRISPRANTLDVPYYDSEDDQATPRVTTKPPLDHASETMMSGAERLRAVLAKTARTPTARASPQPPVEVSEMLSDYDSPHATVAQSVHKQSLKELFSNVTSDFTPQKKKPMRRNSLDSEVEGSPRVELVQQERAKHKGKRRSLSDEEAEKYADLETSPDSFRRSSAAQYDALRQRLTQSESRSPKAGGPSTAGPSLLSYRGSGGSQALLNVEPMSDVELSGTETSGDTAKFLPHLDREASMSTPPMATSTPMRSLQFPSQLQMQSNLLDQDSEMRNAMEEMETTEEESGPSRKPVPFPSTRANGKNGHDHASGHGHGHGRAHSMSHSAHNLPLARKPSAESRTSSRSSSLSASDLQEQLRHERERQWNKPSPRPPSTPESHRRNSHSSPSYNATIMADRESPGFNLSRRGSVASMRSFDDGRSSEWSSLSSHADHRDRMKELEQDKNRERERMWNKPRPRRSSSSLSLNSSGERTRTQSGPTRPDSAMSFSSPRRHPSWGSASSSSRAASPTGSIAGADKEKAPVAFERERNWNSPHPKWEHQVVNTKRSVSPMPHSGSPATSRYNRLSMGSPSDHALGRRPSRNRTVSLGNEDTSVKHSRKDSHPLRTPSPNRSDGGDEEREDEPEPFKSRFGWSMSRNRMSLPPLGSDSDSPQKIPSTPPGSRPSSRLSARPSLIPVRSPRKNDHTSSPPHHTSEDRLEPKPGHRRNQTTLTQASGPVPRVRIEPLDLMNGAGGVIVDPVDLVPTDSESEAESQVTSTPVGRVPPLPDSPDADPRELSPPPTPSPSPSPPSRYVSLAPSEAHSSSQLSPLEQADNEFLLGLSTPPMQSMSLSKLEFQTPSPPRNMPDLPAPPSSSEDETETFRTPAQREADTLGNMTAAKTPRPPGAWAATPAPAQNHDRPDDRAGPAIDDTPTPTDYQGQPSSVAPTPAPPGAWQATPAGSLRRKSILKVRFEGDPNTSVDSMPEVPMVGPADPGDSVSDMFPLINPPSRKPDQPPNGNFRDADSPTTPTTPRPRSQTKPPGVRILDAFGNETVDESPGASSSREEDVDPPEPANKATPRSRTLVRIVDAMGREVSEPDPISAESSIDMSSPLSHRDALARIRATVAKMADDLGESDDSALVPVRDDQRLSDLRRTSQTSLNARKALAESLEKHRSTDAAKYGSLRESMQRNQLLPPVVRSPRFSIDFLNTWVLWSFLVLQVLLIVYMYRLSTIRAKHIFLTTYYDAFSPELFSHFYKSDSSLGIPSSSASFPSLLSLRDTLSTVGWKGAFAQVWAYVSAVVYDWLNQLWDAWERRPGRTIAWPPT